MKQHTIRKGWREPGSFVSVRPCGDEYGDKTYLGIFIGDAAVIGNDEDGEKMDKPYPHNPCIWVPDLGEYIMGFESWWGTIESEKDLHQITDADIENVWYVRALKALTAKDEGKVSG